MSFIKNLLMGSFPPLLVGGTGVGIFLFAPKSRITPNLDEWVWNGIVVGPDAEETGDEAKDLIRKAGLNCGDASGETDCNIGSSGLNIDRGGDKREGYIPSKVDNGKIKFRLLEDNTYKNNFRFTVTEAPIKLESKSDPKQTIILEKYENYEVVKDETEDKVYLTRKLTKEEWIKKALGLPASCNLPTTISTNSFDYSKTTCEPSTTEIKSINFEGKKSEGATSSEKVKLYIKKVNDSKTFREGYKFTFHPFQDVDINTNDKIKANIWKDFRIKESGEDSLVLEKVWKDEKELLKAVGLSCTTDGTCSIVEDSLKIKVGTRSLKNGRKNSGSTGTLKLEKERSGHYEGLRFSVRGGGITIESSTSDSTVQMQEMEIYHIRKEDSRESSHVLARKHDLEEMIFFNLGLDKNGCSLPKNGGSKECTVKSSNLGKIKFHEGGTEKKISSKTDELSVTITAVEEEEKSSYPFGYKFSIETNSGTVTAGGISLTTSATEFKIKKESGKDGPNLYLEKVNK